MESSRIRDRTCVSYIGRQILYHWATREAPVLVTFQALFFVPLILSPLALLQLLCPSSHDRWAILPGPPHVRSFLWTPIDFCYVLPVRDVCGGSLCHPDKPERFIILSSIPAAPSRGMTQGEAFSSLPSESVGIFLFGSRGEGSAEGQLFRCWLGHWPQKIALPRTQCSLFQGQFKLLVTISDSAGV